ncbi:MAG: hypothetical protein U0441_27325 [Polyangiaceae bacterium]
MNRFGLFLMLAIGASGCGLFGGGSSGSRIEHGETVTTGVAAYDAFFREVAEVRADADKGTADLGDAGKPLGDAIGAQAPSTAPADYVRAEAKKLQMAGTLAHLDLLPEAKLVTSGKAEGSTEKLLNAAEQTAKSSIGVARRAGEVLMRIADLERRRADLMTTAKASFPDDGKRAEVTRELGGAAVALKAAREVAEKNGGAASKMALDLAIALETGAGSSAVASAKKPPTKPGTGTGSGTKPGGTGTASPAKPKGDDFEK